MNQNNTGHNTFYHSHLYLKVIRFTIKNYLENVLLECEKFAYLMLLEKWIGVSNELKKNTLSQAQKVTHEQHLHTCNLRKKFSLEKKKTS